MFFPFRDHNPSDRLPIVCYLLIAVNVGVFLAYWLTLRDDNALGQFFYTWGLVPGFVTGGHQWHSGNSALAGGRSHPPENTEPVETDLSWGRIHRGGVKPFDFREDLGSSGSCRRCFR